MWSYHYMRASHGLSPPPPNIPLPPAHSSGVSHPQTTIGGEGGGAGSKIREARVLGATQPSRTSCHRPSWYDKPERWGDLIHPPRRDEYIHTYPADVELHWLCRSLCHIASGTIPGGKGHRRGSG